jgi:hypothetical protein
MEGGTRMPRIEKGRFDLSASPIFTVFQWVISQGHNYAHEIRLRRRVHRRPEPGDATCGIEAGWDAKSYSRIGYLTRRHCLYNEYGKRCSGIV